VVTGYRDVLIDNRFRRWADAGDQPSSWSTSRRLNEENNIEGLAAQP
jgi:hypothetical protein